MIALLPVSLFHRCRLLVSIGAVIFFLLLLRYNLQHNFEVSIPRVHHQDKEELHLEGHCAALQGLGNIFVIIRTGFNEAHQKLLPLLNTTVPCLPHYGIWSDLEETYAGQHIGNALDEIDPDLVASHPDFEYYRRLQEKGRDGFSVEEMASWKHAPNTGHGRDTPAWKLDKWKFLPLAKKAYSQHPTSPWYMFIECDTYVFWDTLLAWLAHFDHTQPFYIGRQMHLGANLFAYGGAGILISNPAMRILVEKYTSNTEFYNNFTISEWAGDYVLGKALSDAGIELWQAWPTLEGDMPATLDFKSKSPAGYHQWCYYATTYHHLTLYDISAYYEFEQAWKSTSPKFPSNGDVFRHLVFPRMAREVSDWDNLSADVQNGDISFNECLKLCEGRPDCVQFSLTNGRVCKTSNVVKLGNERAYEQPSEGRVSSGWMTERVEAFMGAMDESCNGQLWVLP